MIFRQTALGPAFKELEKKHERPEVIIMHLFQHNTTYEPRHVQIGPDYKCSQCNFRSACASAHFDMEVQCPLVGQRQHMSYYSRRCCS